MMTKLLFSCLLFPFADSFVLQWEHGYRIGQSTTRVEVTSSSNDLTSVVDEATCQILEYPIGLDDNKVQIFPAREPLSSFQKQQIETRSFSILSWNILLPNSDDNWWNHKLYAPHVDMEHRQWPHRHALIQQRLLKSDADIICLQEVAADSFEHDFAFLKEAGYEACLHPKYRFRCATFFKTDQFQLEQMAHKDRTLITSLSLRKSKERSERSSNKSYENTNQSNDEKLLHIINCHLSGGAVPERRLRQVHTAVDQIRKWKNKAITALQKQRTANRPDSTKLRRLQREAQRQSHAATIVCGDFNSDGNTGVRRLLTSGSVEPEWREPQYPSRSLTAKPKTIDPSLQLIDAAELAYGSNVCDGDYGEHHDHYYQEYREETRCRPATYVVPNLASMLLLPPTTKLASPTTNFSQAEIDHALKQIELLNDYNALDDRGTAEMLENVMNEYLKDHLQTKLNKVGNQQNVGIFEELKQELLAMHPEHSSKEGLELVEIETDDDVRMMVDRFTPILRQALDHAFDTYSSDGETLTSNEINKFLVDTNGQLGRGGMWRHTQAMVEGKGKAVLNRGDWYAAYAKELGEGKWWQVVYDLEACGASIRPDRKSQQDQRHYQGWLDYIYFDTQQLICHGVQDALTASDLRNVYEDGNALPNEWHPSDHLPVAAVFSWNQSQCNPLPIYTKLFVPKHTDGSTTLIRLV